MTRRLRVTEFAIRHVKESIVVDDEMRLTAYHKLRDAERRGDRAAAQIWRDILDIKLIDD